MSLQENATPCYRRTTFVLTHHPVTDMLPLFGRTTWAVLKHELIVPVMLV